MSNRNAWAIALAFALAACGGGDPATTADTPAGRDAASGQTSAPVRDGPQNSGVGPASGADVSDLAAPRGGEVSRELFAEVCNRATNHSEAMCECLADGAMTDMNDAQRAIWIAYTIDEDTRPVAEAYGLTGDGMLTITGFSTRTTPQCLMSTRQRRP